MLSWHSQIRFFLQGARVALHLSGPRSHVGHKEYNERYVRHTNSPQRHALPRESKHHRIRIKKKKETKENFNSIGKHNIRNARPSKCYAREALSGTTLARTSTTATRNRLTCCGTSCFAWHPRASRFRCPVFSDNSFSRGTQVFPNTGFVCLFIHLLLLIFLFLICSIN